MKLLQIKVWLLLLLISSLYLPQFSFAQQATLRVGVFQGHGASETCVWEAYAACGMDRSLSPIIITSKDLAAGILDELDVIVIPGGGGSREYLNMGGLNRDRIRSFVERGGGYVGICAGAYLASNTPEYSCMRISGGKAIDIEHDNRGRGIAKVTLTTEGKALFGEVAAQDTLYIMYYEGPVIVPEVGKTPIYRTYGMMQSDVHVEGNAPAGMTNNRPFFFLNEVGKGKVFSVVGHPEATPGMQWMLTRMVHAVAPSERKMVANLDSKFVNPMLFNREILMDAERRSYESSLFKKLLYGTPQEKINAIAWLVEVNSWDGKRWLQGLLFDNHASVRIAAIDAIAHSMLRYYINDIESLLKDKKDSQVLEHAKCALERLK